MTENDFKDSVLTNGELRLLLFIYKNNGRITAREQKIYSSLNCFYKKVTKLKKKKIITSHLIENDDKRKCIYELTMRGLILAKIMLGEDYD